MKPFTLPPDYSPEVVAEVRAALVIDHDHPECTPDAETRLLAWAVLKTQRGQTLHQTRLRAIRRAMQGAATPTMPDDPGTPSQRKAA